MRAEKVAVGGRATTEDAPHRDLVEQAARFSQAFLRWLDGPGALTYPRLRVLEVLHCQGPAMMRDLAGHTGLTARNLTTMADTLEHDGLVRRVPHPDDRRATLLELTDAGWQAADESLSSRLGEIARLFDTLSPAERTQMQRILSKLTAAMADSKCNAPAGPKPA